jgi:hypothetical protein
MTNKEERSTTGLTRREHRITTDELDVAAVSMMPAYPVALLALAHGAGAGMHHPHLERLAERLADQGLATLRYQFPYMEAGLRRPDRAPLLEATVRAACDHASRLHPDLPRFAAGRSMGARMTARAQSRSPLAVLGLVFFAFPLHPPVNLADPDPCLERARHLSEVRVPMLFLAGERDRLARPHLLAGVAAELSLATLHQIATADHGFQPTRRSGRTLEDVEEELAAVTRSWIHRVLGSSDATAS